MVQAMGQIKHKILVLSGKGGVGKSTVSSQLALALVKAGYKVGLLDIDLCGPSIPTLLGLHQQDVHQSSQGYSHCPPPLLHLLYILQHNHSLGTCCNTKPNRMLVTPIHFFLLSVQCQCQSAIFQLCLFLFWSNIFCLSDVAPVGFLSMQTKSRS